MESCLYIGYHYWYPTVGMVAQLSKAHASDAKVVGSIPADCYCPSNFCYLVDGFLIKNDVISKK